MPPVSRPSLRRLLLSLVALVVALAVITPPTAATAVGTAPTGLAVNGIAAPVDLEGTPKFSWHVSTATQDAYEIRVSSSAAKAVEQDGDVWTSGKVEGSAQTGVAYGGSELAKQDRYFWTVRTWSDGEASAWAPAAGFGTGPGSSWADSSPIWAPTTFSNWTDFTFETDFTVVQNAASVTFRTTSTGANYLWQIRADSNTLKTHYNGGAVVVDETPLADKGITIKAGESHQLRIEVQGTTIKTWIDDVLVRTGTDHQAHATGGIGFRTGSTEQATFDNVVVKDLTGKTLYSNDFSAPAPEFPTLSVANGRLVVGTSKNDFVPGSWSNYTIRTKLTVNTVATGISFRAADASNSYMWQFRGADNRLVPHRQVSGTYSTLGAAVNLPAGTLANGKEVAVRIEAVGTTIKTWIDDVLVDTRTDATFRRGAVGFRNGNTESGRFRDYSVTDVNPAAGTLLQTTFPNGDRSFGCGTVADNSLTVGNSAICLLNGLTANWAFLRTEVDLPDKEIAWATLYATGSNPKTAKQYVYKAYVNGSYVGLGPTQPVANEARYDGFDVTALLERGKKNALGALAYTTNDQKFQAQLAVEYADGTRDVFGTGSSWRARSGDDVFPAAGSIGTSFYSAPKENLDARVFPSGYDTAGFDDSEWKAPTMKASIGTLVATPTDKVEEQLKDPVKIVDKGNGNYFIDFGRTWIGGVKYDIGAGTSGAKVDLRFGEVTSSENTVRYALNTGNNYQDVVTLRDGAQTIETWGLRVFRYAEIVGAPEPVTAENLKALALVYPFDSDASTFSASSGNLEQVYELSKNSIESLNVNFYTDSWTRERINYEADAYLQLMSTLYVMDDLSLGRYSMNYFKGNRTWPTEWPIYVVLAVHDAWRQTGDTEQLVDYYDNLQTKLPTKWLEESTGLIRKTSGSAGCNSSTDCDIVDWPTSERDGFQFRQYNTVINAISYRAYRDMAAIAKEIGKDADAATYTAIADRMRDAINDKLYDAEGGRYDDGMDASQTKTGHYSVHASAFALAFGVPEEKSSGDVASFIKSRGMACSVYCAAFLIKALYDGGDGQTALDLMTAEDQHSWMNMIKLGAGATAEAWDPALKPNMTYSHPWAASPAFNVPSGLFGIQPLTPGYGTFRVMPQPGDLQKASITVPTVKGSIATSFEQDDKGQMKLSVTVPGNTKATVHVPLADDAAEDFVPAHDKGVSYEGRTTLPGGEFATFAVGAGSWTFGPGAQPDAPTGTIEGSVSGVPTGGWHNVADLTLTTTAPEGAVSEYRIGDGAWQAYTGRVQLPEGDLTVEYRVRLGDEVLDSDTLSVKVDRTAPTATHSVDGRTVTLTGSDAGSGIGTLRFRLDDGEWQTYDQPIVLDDEAHTLEYRAVDVAGNASVVGSVEVQAVYTGGDVTASVSSAGLDGWFGAGAALSLTSEKPVAELQYRLGDGEWTVWTQAVDLPVGTTVVSYRAQGVTGAFSEVSELTVRVDATAPVSSASAADRTVTLTGSDEGGSGVTTIEYRLDGGEWTTYTAPFVVDGDAHVVEHRAVDRAGNVGEVGTLEIDKAPEGPAAAPVATRAPQVSGKAVVGRVLASTAGTWDVAGITTTRQWTRDGAPIIGATSPTYRVQPRDAGARLAVVVTATKPGHATGTATSARTAKVASVASKVSRSLTKRTLRSGGKTTLTVKVRAAGVTPTGKVDVYYRGTKVRSGLTLTDGTLRTSFRPQVRGRHTMKITYRGTTGIKGKSTTIRLRIK